MSVVLCALGRGDVRRRAGRRVILRQNNISGQGSRDCFSL